MSVLDNRSTVKNCDGAGAGSTSSGECEPIARVSSTKRLKLPALRLEQYGPRAGTFVDTATGRTHTQLHGVFLLMRIVRRLFTVENDDCENRRLTCWSDGRAKPSVEVPRPVSENCHSCPQTRWTDDGGKRRPPSCGEVVRAVAVVGDPPRLFQIDFAGMSAIPALAFHGAMVHSTLPALYYARLPLGVETRTRSDGKGRYYAVTFGKWAVIDDEEAAILEKLYEKVESYSLLGRLDERPRGV